VCNIKEIRDSTVSKERHYQFGYFCILFFEPKLFIVFAISKLAFTFTAIKSSAQCQEIFNDDLNDSEILLSKGGAQNILSAADVVII